MARAVFTTHAAIEWGLGVGDLWMLFYNLFFALNILAILIASFITSRMLLV